MKILLILVMGWIMANPYFKLPLRSVHYDVNGVKITQDGLYDLEWLRNNLVLNGSFETWDGSDFDYWNRTGVIGSAVLTQDADSLYGSYSAKWVLGMGGGVVFRTDLISINPSFTYSVSYAGKTTSICAVAIYFYDSSSSYLGSLAVDNITAAGWTEYQYKILSANIPSGTVAFAVAFVPTVGTSFIDGAVLSPWIKDSNPYFDDFALLKQTDSETFTFSSGTLLVGSQNHAADDPTIYMRAESGKFRAEVERSPLRPKLLRGRVTTYAAMNQLRRFHAKTRGIPFSYFDSDGIEYSVVWPGGMPDPGASVNKDYFVVEIPLRYLSVTEGE